MKNFRDMEFSISKMKEVIEQVSSKRVSREAAIELDKDLQDRGEEFTKEAIKIAKENDRKTVREKDMRKAIFNLKSK